MLKFYQNPETKEVVTEPAEGFEEIIANTVDAAKEKHVPVIGREGQTVTVSVGEIAHPMQEAHYIEWILLETTDGQELHRLSPGEEPVTQFCADEECRIIAAYAYCNLHGLWMAEG